jgi:large subunit ribosomal protein L6
LSRIGKEPVVIPDGVEIQLDTTSITVKGPKGSLTQKLTDVVKVTVNKEKKLLTVAPVTDDKNSRGQWGLYRVLINNMVKGVSVGFQKVLEIEGIGYKAEMKGSNIQISAGYSHPILYMPRPGVTMRMEGPTQIVVKGIDKQAVGQVAAEIRNIRPPEPYKGKGIRYQGEHIIRKAGKTGIK